ncbi:cilia- and flagella-associated protein 90-like [Asterias amurensis]|uniref:cilia- and flagella-associated protein 90-like n=1 Tax=Asterias amurensis TaxID=7602 RepID=UPI003AB61FC9
MDKLRIERDVDATDNYFATTKKHKKVPLYDRIYHQGEHDYNAKMHRDDRRSILSLNTAHEEESRKVPLLSSTMIGKSKGHVVDLDQKKNARSSTTQREFYSSKGPPVPFGCNITH